MNNTLLEKALKKNDMEEVERLITEISVDQHDEVISILIKYIALTENPGIRNALAIALRDIGNEKAIIPLIDLIKDPKTIGNRGTLLYALEPFDCTGHLEVIVEQFLTGNYEVQATAYQLLESMDGKVSTDDLLRSLQQVKERLKEIERQHDLHTEVLDFLFDMNVT